MKKYRIRKHSIAWYAVGTWKNIVMPFVVGGLFGLVFMYIMLQITF